MIEIICNENDKNKCENVKTKKNTVIRRPKNIKQIGDVSSDKKIYIEDYAFSYINSVAYKDIEEEQAGVLLGSCQQSGKENCLFIKGVIRAKGTDEKQKKGIYFDENVWNNVYSDIEKYFPDLHIVGWYAAVRNMTSEKVKYLKRVHLDNFAGNMKTMYLINIEEKEENFYLYENGELKKQKGYVCFYERNYEMQEYMLEKRGNKSIESTANDKVMKSIRSIIQDKEMLQQHKKNTTFMYGVCTFMLVVVMVIGINLMNSYEKMDNVDKSLNRIVSRISGSGDEKEQSANVSSDDVVSVNKLKGNVYPTQESSADNTDAANSSSEQGGQTQAASSDESATDASVQAPSQNSDDIKDQHTDADVKTAAQSGTQTTPQSGAQITPQTGTQSAPQSSCFTYTVKQGDTIMNICKRHYGTASKYDDIIKYNNIADPDKLYVGQQIKLP